MKVGLFGLLGAGNTGNDGSLEVVLTYLRDHHPDAEVSALCSGPRTVATRYGIPTTPLYWYDEKDRASGLPARVAMKAYGKVSDALRILRWVARRDVVIVPGAGVLENTLPLRPWGFPLSMFLLSVFGRLTGTKVALVNVGSNYVNQWSMRVLFRVAGRLAHYRSFRDEMSREAVRAMGVDTSADEIYPDLVFALPEPAGTPEPGTVAVGVMDFHGSTDDRADAERINRSYVDAMHHFVRWLVESGHRVRLLTGDDVDRPLARAIVADVHEHCAHLGRDVIVFEPTDTLGEVMAQIARVELVVATRYHNVLCALKLAKPTVSLSYSAKNDRIMAEMGLGDYTQDARHVDVDRLISQFTEVGKVADEIRPPMAERAAAKATRLTRQFEVLSNALGMHRRRS